MQAQPPSASSGAASTAAGAAEIPAQPPPLWGIPPSPSAPAAGAPANVTVVRTARQLQEATLRGAVDIEIREHLDLRNLTRPDNPAIPGAETFQNRKQLALVYATNPLRSIRGNCSDPDPAAAVGVGAGLTPALLPLRPRQCLLLLPDTWLMVNSGTLWIDNLYLRTMRRAFRPWFTFVQFGAKQVSGAVLPSAGYFTRLTLQPDGRGTTIGFTTDSNYMSAVVDDCIFTDWTGFRSPFVIQYQSVVHIRNTVFRNFNTASEIADVSFEGIVHFTNVSLANVTLQHGAVVSTTVNDYIFSTGSALWYYAEDDEAYDVPITPVPLAESSMWGEEFVIVNATMSDCVYVHAPKDFVYPGCPAQSTAARARIILRALDDGQRDYSDAGNAAYAPGYEGLAASPDSQATEDDSNAYPDYYDYVYAGGPNDWFPDQFLDMDDPWIIATQQVLPELPPAPGWPVFQLDSPPRHGNRTSLRPESALHSDSDSAKPVGPGAARMVPVLQLTQPTPQPQAPEGDSNSSSLFLPVLAAVCAAAVALVVMTGLVQLARAWRKDTLASESSLRHHGGRSMDRCHTSLKGHCDSSRSASIPQPTVPLTPMNPEYDYALPPQLAHLAQAPSDAGNSTEPGNTIVLPPYTVTSSDYMYTHDAVDDASQGTCGPRRRHETSTRDRSSQDANPARTHSHSLHTPQEYGTLPSESRPQALEQSDVVPISPQLQGTGSHNACCSAPGSHTACCSAPGGAMSPAWESLAEVEAFASCQAVDRVQPEPTGLSPATHIPAPAAGAGDGVRADSTSGSVTPPAELAAASASSMHEQAEQRLHQQLNLFQKRDVFLGRFKVLGRHQRRRGGQAVVQFMVDVSDRCEYAAKFFLDHDAFRTEAALYAACSARAQSVALPEAKADSASPQRMAEGAAGGGASAAVARFLPQVEAVCDVGALSLADPAGEPLPPCIVMERGESLHDRSDRAVPDLFTSLAVLSNISKFLADMHDAGYVHRDLKPANVMWLPRQNRWTIIDFGSVARIGELAPLSFTLTYAAPEVATAHQRQETRIESQAALDAWSLGIIAVELLTGAPAFDMLNEGAAGVAARLLGALPLPWESTAGEGAQGMNGMLGMLRRPVLQLLQRKPSDRVPMREFHAACIDMFAWHTSAGLESQAAPW